MKKFAVAVSVCMVSLVAHADWQYTKWSMTKSQVEAAITKSGTEVLPPFQAIEEQPTDMPLIAFRTTYEAGGMNFNALFSFSRSTDQLQAVKLVLIDTSNCPVLKASLLEKYGKPESDVDKSLPMVKQRDVSWRDTAGKNYLTFNEYAAMGRRGCSVEYKTMQAIATKGL